MCMTNRKQYGALWKRSQTERAFIEVACVLVLPLIYKVAGGLSNKRFGAVDRGSGGGHNGKKTRQWSSTCNMEVDR